MKFLFRTDVHASDHGPSSWKGDYLGEIVSNLTQIEEIARQEGVLAVLDGGDFFHIKAATRNSHSLVQRMIMLHRKYPCPVYGIEGNHDLAYNSIDTVTKQPIGVMFASGVFHQLREAVFKEDGLQVRVVGVPYTSDPTLEMLRSIRKQPGDDCLIVVAHVLAAEMPNESIEDLFGEPVFRYGDLFSEDGPDAWCFGHWHQDQGIACLTDTILHRAVAFVNQGSVSRGALTHENLTRIPKVALLEFTREGLKVRAIPLTVAPASEVFDLEAKSRAEEERGAIEEFVAKLQMSAQQNPEGAIEETLNNLDFAKDVREAALNYLERARTEVG
jgi:DNA repair exonuclease SbcCD nuclease subunit